MGVPNGGCDDAKTSLNVDWDENSVNYTCFNPTTPFIPDETVESLLHCDNVPKNFLPSKNYLNKIENEFNPRPQVQIHP